MRSKKVFVTRRIAEKGLEMLRRMFHRALAGGDAAHTC